MKRRRDFDLLRALSMLGVVYLHTAAGALRWTTGALWHFSNLVSSLATAAVPLFFMISGALLLSSERTAEIPYLFQKRLPKVIVPLLTWSAVVLVVTGLRGDWPGALTKLTAILNSCVVTPYWFLYALVPMYLVSPFLKKMADGLSPAHWKYLVGLWFVLTLGLGTLRALLPEGVWRTVFTENWSYNINFVGGYLGYFLLGAWLDRLERLPSRKILWGAAAAAFVVIALGTWWATASTGAYDERFKSYLHLFTPVLSVCLFLLARSYCAGRSSGRGLTFLSGVSFGVYLAHPLAIEFWQKVWGRFFDGMVNSIPEQLVFYGAILLSCLAGVVVVASIKPLCWMFTGTRFGAACRECNLFFLLRRRQND